MVFATAYADMLPWVVFAVLLRRGGPGSVEAAGAAAATAAVLAVIALRSGRPAPLARAGLACFLVILAAAWVLPVVPPAGSLRAGAVLVVGLVAVLSIRRTPVAGRYLADEVPPAVQRSVAFRDTARALTRAWAVTACLIAGSFAMLAVGTGQVELTVWGWLVPLFAAARGVTWSHERCRSLVAAAADAGDADAGGQEMGSLAALVHPPTPRSEGTPRLSVVRMAREPTAGGAGQREVGPQRWGAVALRRLRRGARVQPRRG